MSGKKNKAARRQAFKETGGRERVVRNNATGELFRVSFRERYKEIKRNVADKKSGN